AGRSGVDHPVRPHRRNRGSGAAAASVAHDHHGRSRTRCPHAEADVRRPRPRAWGLAAALRPWYRAPSRDHAGTRRARHRVAHGDPADARTAAAAPLRQGGRVMNLLAAHTDDGNRPVHGGTPKAPRSKRRRGAHERHRHGRLGVGNLTGLGHLLLFMVRRDRLWLPIWVLSLIALTAYLANAIVIVMHSESLQAMTVLSKNTVMALITVPGYGIDEASVPPFVVGMYGVFLMLGAALMSILTISRHTRTEEQTGRAELVRANVTGRHTQLIAALVLTVFMNLLLSACMAAAFHFSEAAPEPLSST